MKKLLLSLFVAGSFGMTSTAQLNNLNVGQDAPNFTITDIHYCFYDNSNSCWTTKGWYKIEPYKTVSIALPANSSKVYIHGQSTISSDSFWKDDVTVNWGSGYSLCVDMNNAFEIRNADKVSCDKRKKFSELSTPNKINKFTFNP
jgi:uncharacterized membrane protein